MAILWLVRERDSHAPRIGLETTPTIPIKIKYHQGKHVAAKEEVRHTSSRFHSSIDIYENS